MNHNNFDLVVNSPQKTSSPYTKYVELTEKSSAANSNHLTQLIASNAAIYINSICGEFKTYNDIISLRM